MKKKIFMLALAACMIVLSVAGSSLAYFTDIEAKSNVFTIGNVDIELYYNDPTTTRMYPGGIYEDEATIKNVGPDGAYVGAIIQFNPNTTDLNTILDVFEFTTVNAKTYKYNEATGTIYVLFTNIVTAGSSVNIFDTITIPASWGATEMAIFNNMTISITAYATQTVGFDNAEAALTTAFGDSAAHTAWGTAYAGASNSLT